MNGDRRSTPPFEATSGPAALAEARFIPQRYEPNYPYPLLVLFHGRGSDEHQMLASMPAMSWRNYVGLSLRGPETVSRRGREVGYSWGQPFARPDRIRPQFASEEPPAQVVRRVLEGRSPDASDRLEDSVFLAIRDLRRSLHVHSERIFLVGVGEGAAAAYRLGLTHPHLFAGVVAINGWLPGGPPVLGRVKDCRDLRVLVVHGAWNGRAPVEKAQRDVSLLRTAGLKVSYQAYPCGSKITTPMLSDVDTWLINQCTSQQV